MLVEAFRYWFAPKYVIKNINIYNNKHIVSTEISVKFKTKSLKICSFVKFLTLNASITTSADDIFILLFSFKSS